MEQKSNKKVIAIVGPTACGKTGIGVKLAKEFNGEIISADSRQVYRGLDIGTGKDLKEYDGVKYHLIDIANPMEKMTLFDYLPLVRKAIEDIFSRCKLPVIVGGTGLYVQGLTEGFVLESISKSEFLISNKIPNNKSQKGVIPAKAGIQEKGIDPRVKPEDDNLGREQLDNLTLMQLNDILRKLDSEKYEKVDHKNRHRLIRAIELAQEGLRPTKVKPDFEVLQIGIDIPRKELHERIDKRVDERFEKGMLDEVVCLIRNGVSTDWLKGLGLEYRVITEYLFNCHFDSRLGEVEKSFGKKISRQTRDDKGDEFDAMSQQLKFKIHQFARRQMTWFRRFPEINWLSDYKEIKRFVKIFLEH